MRCVTTMKITDKKQLTKILSFITMSDGSVYRNRQAGNCTFSMSLLEDNLDFITYCKEVIENITSCKMHKVERESPRKNLYRIFTPVHPFFNTLRDRIYVGDYKSLDKHALKLLDFEALAILYMCDGCLGKYEKDGKVISHTVTINMCRLSYGDQLLLKNTIKKNLDLEFNVVRTGKKYFTLRLRSKDHNKFMNGILPFMFKSFLYKVDFRTVNPSSEGDDIV